MIEKTEWEIVDTPRRNQDWTVWNLMQALLGKRWRWKLAGMAVLAGTTLVLFAVVSFITLFVVLTTGVLFMTINKLKSKFSRAGTYSPGRDLMS